MANTPSGDLLLAARPGPGEAVARVFAAGIADYPSHSHQLIADPAAYKEEYKTNNWGVEKLVYWGDQMRGTEYPIPEWDSIGDPKFKGGVLVAYFKQGRQPRRMTYTLAEFVAGAEPELVDLASATVVSDTKERPRFVPMGDGPVLKE